MFSRVRTGTAWVLASFILLQGAAASGEAKGTARPSEGRENFFTNPSFEIRVGAEDGWHIDRGRNTAAEFAVDKEDAAAGERSARVTIGQAEQWGAQFGQGVRAGEKGKTYTFAVLAKSTKGPLALDLQIERRAKPHDRAARSEKFALKKDEWTELHVTFKVEKDFPQGWFAYISCTQPNCEYRADMFRLYEGEYVPYKEIAASVAAAEGVHLFDTQVPSTGPLSPDALLKKEGWAQLKEGPTPGGAAYMFKGDACAVNNYIALVLRRGAKGAECYYRLGDSMVKGPTLIPVGENGASLAKTIDSFKVIENTGSKALLAVNAATESGKKIAAACYLLRTSKPIIEIWPGTVTEKMRVEMQSKHAIRPDLWGGDLVVSAEVADGALRAKVQSTQVHFPSEHMLLQLADEGNAIIMCVWRSGDQKVNMTLDGTGQNRAITATEIDCKIGWDFNVWVGVLAAPGIWYEQKIAELNAVKDKKLDWKIPFPALWRADYRRTDGLIDSWKLPIKKKNGDYESFGVGLKEKRTVWASARGTYAYPGYIEGESAYLRNTKFEGMPEIQYKADGKALIYPLEKSSMTPGNVYTVLDVVAEALEETPAKLPEDMQIKHVPRDRYPATCGVTEEYEKIFDAKQEKAKKAFLLERLEAMDNFVMGIRSRIVEYMDWSKKAHALCVKKKAENPQAYSAEVAPRATKAGLAGLADEFDGVIARFQKRYDDLKLDERTPAAAKLLIEKVKALIDSNEENKVEKAKELGRATRTIGGSQDHAIGDFRLITKELRQRAGYRMVEAKDEAAFSFAKEMRDLTGEMLYCSFGHEGPSTN